MGNRSTGCLRKSSRGPSPAPTGPHRPEGITVADLVGRGRHPHQGMFARWSKEDDLAVARALDATETTALVDRAVDELSGGQRQRVWIAMALAQETDVLLLDEPTTFLDVSHQVEVLDLLTDLNRTRGTTVVMVLHDLNLAARYADHLIALHAGKVRAIGTPADVSRRTGCARPVRNGQPDHHRPHLREAADAALGQASPSLVKGCQSSTATMTSDAFTTA